MKAAVITMIDHDDSVRGANNCISSHNIVMNRFPIIKVPAFATKETIDEYMKKEHLTWTYPWEGHKYDLDTGLHLRPYQTANPYRRVGCYCSHHWLWKLCAESDEPFLILEHDTIFTKTLDIENIMSRRPEWELQKWIIGINSPLNATRLASKFHNEVMKHSAENSIIPVPRVDDPTIPQGLAGNSAYIITPYAAQDVLKKVRKIGAWPNDAFLCYQLFPYLRVTTQYYTKVQGMRSTTTL